MLQDGVHQCEDPTPQYTEEQLKLITTQDLKYVNFKRSLEQKVSDLLRAFTCSALWCCKPV